MRFGPLAARILGLFLLLLPPSGYSKPLPQKSLWRLQSSRRALARRRFGEKRKLQATSPSGAQVSFRGLGNFKQLRLLEETPPPGSWALWAFRLQGDGRDLWQPGLLSVSLDQIHDPDRIQPLQQSVELYQELPNGGGWMPLFTLARSSNPRALRVLRMKPGTGRFVVGYRLEQPPELFEIQNDPLSQGPVFLLLHGYDGGLNYFTDPRGVLSWARGFSRRVHFFQYPSGRPLIESARALREKLQELAQRYPEDLGRRHILMAYSMGGLVARELVEGLEAPLKIGELILLASPSQGVPYGSLAELLPFLRKRVRRHVTEFPGTADLFSGSAFLRQLNGNSRPPPETRYLVLASKVLPGDDGVVSVRSTSIPRSRRPQDYRHVTRGQYFNFDLYSHFGARYEFTRNGFSSVAEEWLDLERPTRRYEPEERLARLRYYRDRLSLSQSQPRNQLAPPIKTKTPKAATTLSDNGRTSGARSGRLPPGDEEILRR